METYKFRPLCPKKNIIEGAGYRFSVLTDNLLRLEYEKDGHFTDNATQTVFYRDFPEVSSLKILEDTESSLVFETSALRVSYNKGVFSSSGLVVELLDFDNGSGKNMKWNYGEDNHWRNLFGTVRTLDETNGVVMYGKGLFGRDGYAVFDDGASCELCGEEIFDRVHPEIDLYFFGYGKDFYGGLKAFYKLCGKAPLIPKYALGNWWSKYEKYTEKSYLELMDRFEEENIPISVAVIDMDWHLTEIDPKYGSGWTGYTWNKEFFPDYKRFLSELHRRGMAVTLNLHPADGIRAFEDCYERVARRVFEDSSSPDGCLKSCEERIAVGEPVEFDLMNKKFVDAYFEEVMHPYEDDGVDFWWIDWQQGTKAKTGSVDPLWLLNHYHYIDQVRRGKRAMIFSRYAGLGSHRYPIGFSGDTYATWESLAIQPFFTATASNVGYGWWSHDIGGHMHGEEDVERTTRWVQFGVFSPIMRLHSSCNPFFFKEPWNLPSPMRQIVGDFMRLRHRMIPYLYSECYKAWQDDVPLIRPLYYDSPDEEGAYGFNNNGYMFGSELAVYPITEPKDKELQMGRVHAFIPAGRWIDIFDGKVYEGPCVRNLYRPLESIPVLIKAGGIVPMSDGFYVGAGASGTYTLYDDDTTLECTVRAIEGRGAIWGQSPICTVQFGDSPQIAHSEIEPYVVLCGVDEIPGYEYDSAKRQARIPLGPDGSAEVEVNLGSFWDSKKSSRVSFPRKDELFRFLKRCEISYDLKERLYRTLCDESVKDKAEYIRNLDISEKLKDALEELHFC